MLFLFKIDTDISLKNSAYFFFFFFFLPWRHINRQYYIYIFLNSVHSIYEGESISNQPNLFPVEIHLFFFDVIAL